MRLKQWFYSILLFAGSVAFLFYSTEFFRPEQSLRVASLPPNGPSSCNSTLLANQDYYPFLKQYFQKAERSIIGTVYLFKTAAYRDNEPADLLRELVAARKRGVRVELVIDSPSEKDNRDANFRAAELLQRAGVVVRLDRPDIATHSKTFVIDDRYCFLGSHNFTHAAMTSNRELSLFIDSPELAGKITSYIRAIPLPNPATAHAETPR